MVRSARLFRYLVFILALLFPIIAISTLLYMNDQEEKVRGIPTPSPLVRLVVPIHQVSAKPQTGLVSDTIISTSSGMTAGNIVTRISTPVSVGFPKTASPVTPSLPSTIAPTPTPTSTPTPLPTKVLSPGHQKEAKTCRQALLRFLPSFTDTVPVKIDGSVWLETIFVNTETRESLALYARCEHSKGIAVRIGNELAQTFILEENARGKSLLCANCEEANHFSYVCRGDEPFVCAATWYIPTELSYQSLVLQISSAHQWMHIAYSKGFGGPTSFIWRAEDQRVKSRNR